MHKNITVTKTVTTSNKLPGPVSSYCPGRGRVLLTLFEEVVNTFVDVRHPLGLFGRGGGVHGERLGPRAHQPAVLELTLVLEGFQLHLLQRDDALTVVLWTEGEHG